MPPRMYYVLNKDMPIYQLLEKRELCEPLFVHKHEDIYYDNLGMY